MTTTTTGSNIETEYLELTTNNGWPALYQRIRSESSKNNEPCSEAIKPQNKILNRYRDVSPYDHSRIVLQRGSTDYINANLIRIDKANRHYILTQGPLSNTVSHFWLMVWEQRTQAVLMLNKLIEKRQEKCCQYWPTTVGSDYVMIMDDVGLTLEYVEHHDHSYYLTRKLCLTDIKTGDSRNILQFHYTTWPDFGVPSSPTAFLEFLRKVRDAGVLDADVGPAVVHCSAGIGRSGTFCLVDSCLVLIEKFGINSVDIKEILFEMRNYRMGLIQTHEQLRFSYQAIIEGTKYLLNPTATNIANNHIDITTNGVTTTIGDDGNVDEVAATSDSNEDNDDEDDDDPPPIPPPRGDSLKPQNGIIAVGDRPLPKIPNSASLNEEYYIPNGPLPVVPADGEEDEQEEEEDEDEVLEEGSDEDEILDEDEVRSCESPLSEKSDDASTKDGLSPSELRRRNRVEHKEKLEAKVRDMKRRQQVTEQWTQLKRPKTSTLQD